MAIHCSSLSTQNYQKVGKNQIYVLLPNACIFCHVNLQCYYFLQKSIKVSKNHPLCSFNIIHYTFITFLHKLKSYL